MCENVVEPDRRRRQHKTTHAFCMLGNWVCKHTLRICNSYCVSTATMVGRTRRNVTLYLHCLYCLILMSICLCHLLLPVHNCMCISKNLRPFQSVISKRGLQFHFGRNGCGRLYAIAIFIRCSEGKSFPLQAWSGPGGSRKLSFPDFTITAQDGRKVSLTHRPPLPPVNTPGTHFC